MHRQQLLEQIQTYRSRYSTESDVAVQFEEFVKKHEDCFERSCIPGHVTGSAWILDTSGSHTLLTHHRKLNMWIQLGGHSDGDPDSLNVALREANEESGLEVVALDDEVFDLDVHLIPARKSDPAHYHYDVRFLLQAKSDGFTVSEESLDLRWLSADELPALTQEASMLRMLEKWSLRWPHA
jgi:8-oxo-dGTP pyrophosphatase MutT (NUDIX family)